MTKSLNRRSSRRTKRRSDRRSQRRSKRRTSRRSKRKTVRKSTKSLNRRTSRRTTRRSSRRSKRRTSRRSARRSSRCSTRKQKGGVPIMNLLTDNGVPIMLKSRDPKYDNDPHIIVKTTKGDHVHDKRALGAVYAHLYERIPFTNATEQNLAQIFSDRELRVLMVMNKMTTDPWNL